jgi:hypothetical protein
LLVCEWAVKKDVFYNFGNCPAGTGDIFFCCWWEVLVTVFDSRRHAPMNACPVVMVGVDCTSQKTWWEYAWSLIGTPVTC